MKASKCIVVLGALLFNAALNGPARADVVADSACPDYAADLAAFATCDGAHVARADGIEFVSAQTASHMKQVHGAEVLLIDVRSRAEAAINGIATQADALVPYQALSSPLHWNNGSVEPAQEPDPSFVAVVRATALTRGGTLEMPLVLLCRDGTLALQAAVDLRAAGFAHVYVVDGGFEGQVDREQNGEKNGGESGEHRRSGGWKQAQLPWTAQVPSAAVLFGPSELMTGGVCPSASIQGSPRTEHRLALSQLAHS